MRFMSWVVIVPVKGTARAKSRLGAHPERSQLAEAFALDTVTALLAAPAVSRVFVVTADDEIAERMSALGADIIRESVDRELRHPESLDPESPLPDSRPSGVARPEPPVRERSQIAPSLALKGRSATSREADGCVS